MLTMVDKQAIIHAYRRPGASLRGVAKELGINRATVTKIINEYKASLEEEDPAAGLNRVVTTAPDYDASNRKPRVMDERYTKEIDYWLSENEKRNGSLRKQRMNAKDIHRALLDKGLEISYSSVCKYVARQKDASRPVNVPKKNVFIKQQYEPGQQCEFDWGDVNLNIDGKRIRFTMAVFTLSYSNGRYAYLFTHQDTLALLEAHRNFFREVGGVPQMMVYDNMRVAVLFTPDGKKPTETMSRLRAYYGFDIRFCNARSGWEKGHVERSVEIVRSRAFKTRIDFESKEEAQQWLDRTCHSLNTEVKDGSSPFRLIQIQEDKDAMSPLRGDIGCYDFMTLSVDKESTICYKYVHYSVPEHLAGTQVYVRAYSEKLEIFDLNKVKVATHERSYVKNDWKMDINHYLNTLMKKPGALPGAMAFKQLPVEMQRLYTQHFKENNLDFLKLLKFARENNKGYEEILAAASIAKKRGVKKLSSDILKAVMVSDGEAEGISAEAKASESFMEIEIGSEDILNQLSNLMTNKRA